MDPVHAHLLINHLPIFAPMLALPLLAIAIWRKDEVVALLGAVILLVAGGGGAFLADETGEGAEDLVEYVPDVSEAWIEEHEERAEIAVVLAVATAIGGIGTLGWAWRRGSTPVPAAGVLLVATMATSGAMAWTGVAGGQIRHSEIRDDSVEPGGAAEAEEEPQGQKEEWE
jgi:hypothetical protein